MRRDAGPFAAPRVVRAELAFVAGGGRTVLARQHVPYPFHITRPFHLDRAAPALATLYLQSASGGIYRGDDLELALGVASGSAHITTQAATVVHATGTQPATQRTRISVGATGFLAYTPDPLVLFPGASLRTELSVVLEAGARAILTDSFTTHDPGGADRRFERLSQRLTIGDGAGRTLVREAADIGGADLATPASPIGRYRAVGTALLLAPEALLPDTAQLVRVIDGFGCLAGATALPNGAGRLVRCLADNAHALRQALHSVFQQACRSMAGIEPARRPK